MSMESSERIQIILGAVAAAGPIGNDMAVWQLGVNEAAAQITAMCDERSSVSRTVDGVASSKVFSASILQIRKEATSQRGLVKLKTTPSKFYPDGVEEARTERADAGAGREMALKLRSLVGHRVVIWIELVKRNDNSGQTVRIIRHVEDLGVDETLDEQVAS